MLKFFLRNLSLSICYSKHEVLVADYRLLFCAVVERKLSSK